jgi:DNA repair protein RecO (recombination protein O)
MSRTYKAIGINLKAVPLGEADRVLTILTKEHGLVRVVAMGARKPNSRMGGRSGLFVVNDLLIAKGKSIDKITQAETLESYPGLSRNLKKLTAGQYLAELALEQALSEQPQEELFYLLGEHLERIERSTDAEVLPRLIHAVFQLLAIAGIAPQVYQCCVTQEILEPDLSNSAWQAGFSTTAGGAVTLKALEQILEEQSNRFRVQSPVGEYQVESSMDPTIEPAIEPTSTAVVTPPSKMVIPKAMKFHTSIDALELAGLQQLTQAELPDLAHFPESTWFSLERLLRQYAQFHLDRPIRSASLIDSCFAPSELMKQP